MSDFAYCAYSQLASNRSTLYIYVKKKNIVSTIQNICERHGEEVLRSGEGKAAELGLRL